MIMVCGDLQQEHLCNKPLMHHKPCSTLILYEKQSKGKEGKVFLNT